MNIKEFERGLYMQDLTAYAAWGCLKSFAMRDGPEYLREMVRGYEREMAEGKAVCEAAKADAGDGQ